MPVASNIFVENLTNSSLLAAIFALILDATGATYFAQTFSELP